jgi:hypothetical protein
MSSFFAIFKLEQTTYNSTPNQTQKLFPATITFLLAFTAWKKNKTLKREMQKHNKNNKKQKIL